MCVALCRTPVADVRAQLANLLGERTVAGYRINAQSADHRALDAAGRTAVFAFLTHHVRKADTALYRAVVAGFDAVPSILVQMMTHIDFLNWRLEILPTAIEANLSCRGMCCSQHRIDSTVGHIRVDLEHMIKYPATISPHSNLQSPLPLRIALPYRLAILARRSFD